MKAFILTKLFLTSPRATLPVKLKISLQTACYVIPYLSEPSIFLYCRYILPKMGWSKNKPYSFVLIL